MKTPRMENDHRIPLQASIFGLLGIVSKVIGSYQKPRRVLQAPALVVLLGH